MRYSFRLRGQIFVKSYGFFLENINDKYSNKYSLGTLATHKKLLDHAGKIYCRFLNNISERVNKKTAETTGDLIGNKIADRITKVSIQKQLQMRTIKKYLREDIYLQKKDRKLFLI